MTGAELKAMYAAAVKATTVAERVAGLIAARDAEATANLVALALTACSTCGVEFKAGDHTYGDGDQKFCITCWEARP